MTGRSLDRVCVLGSAGFVGAWLVTVLREAGITTTTVDRATGNPQPDVVTDLLEADVQSILRDLRPHAVVHLATTASVPQSLDDPAADLRSNVETTVRLLEACRRQPEAPLVAIASSAAVYGDSVVLPIREDHPTAPVSPYGVSKFAAEEYLQLYARRLGVPGVAFRSFSLYGPGQRKLVVYDLIRRTLDGEHPLRIAAPPDVTRDFVFAADAVRAMLAVMRRAPAHGEAYNLATGRGVTLQQLATEVQRACGVPPATQFTGVLRPGDPHTWIGESNAARRLGANFDTSLEAGIGETVGWVASG